MTTLPPSSLIIKAGQNWRTKRGHAVRIICGPTSADDDSPNVYPITGAYDVRVNGRLGQTFNKQGQSLDGDELTELLP